MTTLTRTQTVMHRERGQWLSEVWEPDTGSVLFVSRNDDDGTIARSVDIPLPDWVAMGSPEVFAVNPATD